MLAAIGHQDDVAGYWQALAGKRTTARAAVLATLAGFDAETTCALPGFAPTSWPEAGLACLPELMDRHWAGRSRRSRDRGARGGHLGGSVAA